MVKNNTRKELFVKKQVKNYVGKCPECLEKGVTRVLPFSDDSFYCENPNCPVIRHSNEGHHRFTRNDIKLSNVNYVDEQMVVKRN